MVLLTVYQTSRTEGAVKQMKVFDDNYVIIFIISPFFRIITAISSYVQIFGFLGNRLKSHLSYLTVVFFVDTIPLNELHGKGDSHKVQTILHELD